MTRPAPAVAGLGGAGKTVSEIAIDATETGRAAQAMMFVGGGARGHRNARSDLRLRSPPRRLAPVGRLFRVAAVAARISSSPVSIGSTSREHASGATRRGSRARAGLEPSPGQRSSCASDYEARTSATATNCSTSRSIRSSVEGPVLPRSCSDAPRNTSPPPSPMVTGPSLSDIPNEVTIRRASWVAA